MQVLAEFKKRGAFILNATETNQVGNILLEADRSSVNRNVVGQSPQTIAKLAGVAVSLSHSKTKFSTRRCPRKLVC